MRRRFWIAACLTPAFASPLFAQAPEEDRAAETPHATPSGDVQPNALAAELLLPVTLRGVGVGDVPTRLTGDRLLGVDPSRLAQVLARALSDASLAPLKGLGSGYASPEALASAGFRLSYDAGALSINVDVETSSFRNIDIFLSQRGDYADYDLIEPANFALGLDGSLLLGRRFNRGGDTDASLHLNGFVNLGGEDGAYADFAGRVNLARESGEEAFVRERLTLFKDDRERALRYSAIDVRPDPLPLLGSPNFLGVGVERRYSDIRPDRIIRSLGQRSITLDRPATIEVEVNGVVIRRFRAATGTVSLHDIPFTDIGNEVRIYVDDELGRREVDYFTFSSRENLLAKGVSELGLAGGALQRGFSTGVDWDTDRFGAIGYYRQGVTPELTLGAGAAMGEDGFASISGNLVVASPYGVGQLDAAWSTVEDADGGKHSGVAAAAIYDVDFEGLRYGRDQINLRVDYRSDKFSTLSRSDFFSDDGERLSASGSYRMRWDNRTSLNLGAGYSRLRDQDEVSLRAGVSHRFGALSASASIEHRLRDERSDETRFLLSASMPLGDDQRLSGSYASDRERLTLDYAKRHQNRVGQYGYRLRTTSSEDSLNLYGNAEYIGNRFVAAASLDHVAEDAQALFNDDSPLVGTLRLSSGLAVADGRIGVGRRVGRGFILVDPHPSLEDATFSIGETVNRPPLVRSDGLGPLVVPISGDYRFSRVALNVDEAPLGYDFGSGVYAAQGGARVGAVAVVGSDAFYSARGVLHDSDGQAISLQYGRLVPLQNDGVAVDLFTNSVGIFFASGLSPGAYHLEIGELRQLIEIAPPAEGAMIELGDMILERAE